MSPSFDGDAESEKSGQPHGQTAPKAAAAVDLNLAARLAARLGCLRQDDSDSDRETNNSSNLNSQLPLPDLNQNVHLLTTFE